MKIMPLQLKRKNFFGELPIYRNNNREMFTHNDDKELFGKGREIWNNITESIGINNTKDFVGTTLDDGDEFIEADVHKHTSFVEGNYRDKLVKVLHFVINDYP